MPWKETSAMDERMRFIGDYLREEWSLSELCRMYGISRPTGYKWIRRYEEEGVVGLEARSRAPHHPANAVSEKVVGWIVEGRERHPTWGPRKLLLWLDRRHPRYRDWPAASTVGEILKRHGLVRSRRRRVRGTPSEQPLSQATGANEVWCADFKGEFYTGDGTRCVPLTVSDVHTRFLLRCQGLRGTRSERVRGLFEATFYEYGLPKVIRTDNGPPFATVGLGGLSRLSIWWIKLGITPERIEPGKPHQNGVHERMHRTLKADAINPPARTLRTQQRVFDRFRQEYNYERPHEALGQRPPGEVYEPSPRRYVGCVEELVYPETMEVRRVKGNGEISWRNRKVFLSEVLAGERIGLEEMENGEWGIYLGDFYLGKLDSIGGRVIRAEGLRKGRSLR